MLGFDLEFEAINESSSDGYVVVGMACQCADTSSQRKEREQSNDFDEKYISIFEAYGHRGMDYKRPKVLVGCTGSVASVKIPVLLDTLMNIACQPEVQLISTENSRNFFDEKIIRCPVYTDEKEWKAWTSVGDPVLHIELRRWADIMVIAPLDANTLAKIAHGICDNLLTCVVRAWDLERPLLFAPAMNTFMWQHPLTAEHISTLKRFGYQEIPCISKKLACGDTGMGAMAEVPTIVAEVEQLLKKSGWCQHIGKSSVLHHLNQILHKRTSSDGYPKAYV